MLSPDIRHSGIDLGKQFRGELDAHRALAAHQEKSLLQVENASLKSKFYRKITELEKMIEQQKGEKKQLQGVIQVQKQNYEFQLKEQEHNKQEVVRELRNQQKQLEAEAPQFKHKLEEMKLQLSGNSFDISEEAYVDIKGKPEERRSFKEWI